MENYKSLDACRYFVSGQFKPLSILQETVFSLKNLKLGLHIEH